MARADTPSQATGVWNALQRFDQRRAGVPGEHWATFGLAMAAFRMAGRRRSPVLKLVVGAVGVALVVRAVSGRDGVLGMMRRP